MKYLLITITIFNFINYNFSQENDNADLFIPTEVTEEQENILQEAEDNTFYFKGDISLRLSYDSNDPELGDSSGASRIFRRDSDGYFLTLQEEPVSRLGEGYLETDQGTWFYDAESRQFYYSSPQERFFNSDVTAEDLKGFKLSANYKIIRVEEAQLGSIPTTLFALESTNDENRASFVRVWVSKEPKLILKMEDYSLTRRLLETTYIPSYIQVEDAYFVEKAIIVNNVIAGRRITITYEDVSLAPIPDTVFSKAYVERVNR